MLYAAYGSNLHPVRLRERVPSATLRGKAVLNGRVLRFHKRSVDGSAKCNITTAAGAVHIAVYDILDREKPALDKVEGVGTGYTIETIDVAGYGQCYTYIATATHVDESLKPYSWYKELVVIGCKALQFPPDYLAGIAAVETVEDPDPTRNASQMELVNRARNGGP